MSFIDVLMLNVKDYLDTVLDIHINLLILAIALTICVAIFIINYHNSYTVNLLKSLVRHKAYGEESAKTISELRLESPNSIKRALSRSGQLTSIVKRVGEPRREEITDVSDGSSNEEALTDETDSSSKPLINSECDCNSSHAYEKIDFNTARFFIPKDKLQRAQRIIETENPSLLRAALFSVLIILVFVGVMYLMPGILTLISKNV